MNSVAPDSSALVVRAIGFQYTDGRSFTGAATTVYTDATGRISFAAKTYPDGKTKYPTRLMVSNRDATSDLLYLLYNSSRATSAYAARATVLSAVITDVHLVGALGNSMTFIAVTISGNSTTATTVVSVASGGTTTITFFSETAAAGTATSTQGDFTTAINAAASAYVSAAASATPATVVVSVTATVLAGGYNKDSQSARSAAIGTAATLAAGGYRFPLAKATAYVTFDDAEGIVDLCVIGVGQVTAFDVVAWYPAEY